MTSSIKWIHFLVESLTVIEQVINFRLILYELRDLKRTYLLMCPSWLGPCPPRPEHHPSLHASSTMGPVGPSGPVVPWCGFSSILVFCGSFGSTCSWVFGSSILAVCRSSWSNCSWLWVLYHPGRLLVLLVHLLLGVGPPPFRLSVGPSGPLTPGCRSSSILAICGSFWSAYTGCRSSSILAIYGSFYIYIH